MGGCLLLIGIIFTLCLLGNLIIKNKNGLEEKIENNNYIEKIYKLNYHAGVDGLSSQTGEMLICDDKFIYEPSFNDNDIEIYLKDIKEISIKTDIEIQEQITLGRVICLGVFSLLAKKKKKIESKYLLIRYKNKYYEKDNIILFDCVLESQLNNAYKTLDKYYKHYYDSSVKVD